jgi:hypothetical protein
MDTIRISPRYLGKMNLESFCPCCFWFLIALGFHPPFEMPMPGIMYNLDNFEKNIVDAHFQAKGKLPNWLADLGCVEPVEFPSKMTCEFPDYGLTMVGMPDAVFRKKDHSLYLIDYKSARYKGEDDPFMPCYESQLLGYAHLLEASDIGKVSSAALVYFENRLGDYKGAPLDLLTKEGFSVPFGVKIHPVEIDQDGLDPLLKKFRKYADMSAPPDGVEDCKDCKRIDALLNLEIKRRNIGKSLDRYDHKMQLQILDMLARDFTEAKVAASWASEEDIRDLCGLDVDCIPGVLDY